LFVKTHTKLIYKFRY